MYGYNGCAGPAVSENITTLMNIMRLRTMTMLPLIRDEQYKRALPKITQFPRYRVWPCLTTWHVFVSVKIKTCLFEV